MPLTVEDLDLDGVKLVTPKRIEDSRGSFCETYNRRQFADAGITADFIQDNQSVSAPAYTVRGLHYQSPPFAQAKLVRVLKGSIVDVVVDVRKGSPDYGKWVKAVLSAENGVQIFVPRGYLHGFVTLEPDTHVAYKVDAYYDRASDGAVKWDDPDLGIDWGVDSGKAVLSDKDKAAPAFSAFESPF